MCRGGASTSSGEPSRPAGVTPDRRDDEADQVTSWECPKCGRWHEMTSCDDALALERFAQLLEASAERAAEASAAEDEELRRFLGRSRGEDKPAA